MHYSLRFARLDILLTIGFAFATSACGGSTSDHGPDGDNPSNTDGGVGGGHDASKSVEGDKDSGAPTPDAGTVIPSGGDAVAVPLTVCVPPVYAADVAIGSQQFRLLFDTGSTSLGVAGKGCSDCSVDPLYTPGTSAVDQNKTANSQFGSGSFSGEIFQDSVSFAPPTFPLNFVSITSQTGFFQPGSTCGGKPYQGIMGFGRDKAALPGTKGFYDAMIGAQHLPDVFAHELCDTGGTLWLGGYDASQMTDAPKYTPFTQDLASGFYYTVDLEKIEVAGATGAATIATSTYQDSIVDSGTSVFIMGQAAFTQLTSLIAGTAGFKQVFGAQAATFFTGGATGQQCMPLSQTKAELDATLPPLTLTFGKTSPVAVTASATESYLMPDGSGAWCNTLLPQPQSPSFPIASLMGAPILRSNIVIYDRAKGQVGFAPHKACKTTQKRIEGDGPSIHNVQPRIGYPISQ